MAKRYEDLSFTDDFMFCKVLQNNPDVCRELTELILGKKIGKIIDIKDQNSIAITADGHGVRFDVYFEDDKNSIFDIEMQQSNISDLPYRTRYYQGMIDLNQLEKGGKYTSLKQSYIIFITTDNPYSDIGLHKYDFRSICTQRQNLEMGDGTSKIFLCAKGTQDDVSKELEAFLKYVAEGTPSSGITRKLDRLVKKARRHTEWRTQYMTLLERDEMMREEGRQEERARLETALKEINAEKEAALQQANAEKEAALEQARKERAEKEALLERLKLLEGS